MTYSLDTTLEELCEQYAISVRTMHTLKDAGLDTLRKIMAVEPRTRLMDIRGFGPKCFWEIKKVLKKTSDKKPGPIHAPSPFPSENIQETLPRQAKDLCQRRYKDLCQIRLGVRAQKLLAKAAPSFEDIVPYLDKDIKRYQGLCPGQNMNKTLKEIFDMAQIFREDFLRYSSMDGKAMESELLKNDFPYLSSSQRSFVLSFNEQEGHLPLFYLVCQYLMVSQVRDDKIFALYYGLYDGNQYSIKEIAIGLSFSIQRIQQIMGVGRFAEGANVNGHKDWEHYAGLLEAPYVTATNEQYARIASEERLGCPFTAFVGMMSLFSRQKLEIVNGLPIAVNEDLKFKQCVRLNEMERTLNARYSEDKEITIKRFVSSPSNEATRGLARTLLVEYYNVPVSEKGFICLKQNYIDVGKELHGFLQQAGHPLSIEELFALFKKKYPSHRYAECNQIRPFLFQDKRIRPMGKTGVYGLDCWTDVYYGTIRDLLIDILEKDSKPVHITDIETNVRKYFPETNAKSLASSMVADEMKRFVQFDDGFFGLACRQYNEDIKRANTYRRSSFDQRLKAYRDFVETFHRRPLSTGGEAEGSLYRWQCNFSKGIVESTTEQKQLFEALVQEWRGKGYPQSGAELETLSKCEEYKAYVEKCHSLPTASTEPSLYQWFRKSKGKYDGYTDQRRKYLTELYEYLASLGFPL